MTDRFIDGFAAVALDHGFKSADLDALLKTATIINLLESSPEFAEAMTTELQKAGQVTNRQELGKSVKNLGGSLKHLWGGLGSLGEIIASPFTMAVGGAGRVAGGAPKAEETARIKREHQMAKNMREYRRQAQRAMQTAKAAPSGPYRTNKERVNNEFSLRPWEKVIYGRSEARKQQRSQAPQQQEYRPPTRTQWLRMTPEQRQEAIQKQQAHQKALQQYREAFNQRGGRQPRREPRYSNRSRSPRLSLQEYQKLTPEERDIADRYYRQQRLRAHPAYTRPRDSRWYR